MTLGQRLKKIRGRVNQTDFAATLGVSKNTYASYERGQTSPDARFLTDIVEKFDVNPTWLLTGLGETRLEKPVRIELFPEDGGIYKVSGSPPGVPQEGWALPQAAAMFLIENEDTLFSASQIAPERQKMIKLNLLALLPRLLIPHFTVKEREVFIRAVDLWLTEISERL